MTKAEKYEAGLWVASVPYVSHLWADEDWIRHIDQCGRWFNSRAEMVDIYGPDFFGEVEGVRGEGL